MRVLLVEDERRLAENVATSLREACGYAVDSAADGEEGLYMAQANTYDAVVLDLMLPRMAGEQVLRRMRQKGQRTPVLVLTAKDDTQSIVDVLNAGADDYLTKPFDLGELHARLRALIRRSQGHASVTLQVSDLEMDTSKAQVKRAGKTLALVPMEYRLLEYMMHRPGVVISKTEMLEHLYDFNWERFSNVIEVYIAGLRKKIDSEGQQKLIHTLRGHGYVLREEEQG